MKKKLVIIGGALAVALVSGFSWAFVGQRVPVEFYTGHTHDEAGDTHGAPQHSGGRIAMAVTTAQSHTIVIEASG